MAQGVPFVKANACGNDFLILDEVSAEGRYAALARKLCARTTGVGADGIEFIARKAEGHRFLRLFNADGSEAELSGNGTRCVAAWLAESEGLRDVVLATHGGPRRCRVVRQEGTTWHIDSAMGIPRVMRRKLRIAGVDGEIEGAMVHVGNPHFVLFPERADFGSHGLSWQALGEKISTDPAFHFGTNVEFVHVLTPDQIEFRVFERGCGPTSSSGTGTCASAAAAMLLRNTAHELTVEAPGGRQTVQWVESAAEMQLTGPADLVCTGKAFV